MREDFPGFDPTPLHHEAGPITLVPDEHFVIDRRGPIVVGAACIGHAFKFSPVLGELFADLAEERPLPPEARRFGSTARRSPPSAAAAASPSAPDPRTRALRRGVQSALTARGGRMAEHDGERLGKGNLTLKDVVAQSVGYMGPVFSGTFFIPTIVGLGFAGHGAGIASPFAILLTAIGMLALAWIISRYAKRIHAAGALYDYVREGFGRPTGLFAGWVYYGGALMLTLAIGLAFGGFLSLTLAGVHGIDIDWIWFTLAFWIVAWAISVLGVQISTRAQLVLALVSIAVIFAWAIYVILKGGSDGFSVSPFNPGESSFTGITYGIVYAGLIFVGFESAANLAEETAEPKRNIPRAIFYSVLAGGHLLRDPVVGARAGVRSQRRRAAEELPAALRRDGQPRLRRRHVQRDRAVAGRDRHRRGRPRHRDRHDARLLRAGRATATCRARSPRCTRASRRRRSRRAVIAVGAIVVAIIVSLSDGLAPGTPADPPGGWFPIFQFGATIGAFLIFVVYLLIALTGFKGQPGENRGGLALAGVLAGATAVAALYGV